MFNEKDTNKSLKNRYNSIKILYKKIAPQINLIKVNKTFHNLQTINNNKQNY